MAIARNHGFQDGNKRTGWASLLVFLELNGFQLVMTNDITPALWVEARLVRKTSEEELAEFLAPHLVAIDNAILATEHGASQPDFKI
jgi:death on curing protein